METNENVLINKVEDFNIGNTIKSGDQTLLKYKILDGDGEILDLAGSPCRAVVKKHGREVYSTTDVTIAADNVAQFRITEVLPADEKKPYMVEFIINEDDKPQIFPSKDTIELYILSSSILEEKAIIQSAGCKTAEEIILKKANPILDGIDEAEATRRTSEDTRVTNELARERSEEDREFEEVLRQLSEADREYGESTRVAAESNRKATFDELVDTGVLQTNINTKLSDLEQTYAPKLPELDNNEDARKTAESARETNEAVRQDNELVRQSQEESREIAETARQEEYDDLIDTGVMQTKINERLEDLEEEYAPKLTEVTAQLAQTDDRTQWVSVDTFGAKGDEDLDSTDAIQAAINYAIDNQVPLYFPNKMYRTTGLDINGNLIVKGNVILNPYGKGIDYILNIKSPVIFEADLTINGEYATKIGVIGDSFQRSYFSRVDVSRCRVWGFKFLRGNNNNMVEVGFFRARINGRNDTIGFTQTSDGLGSGVANSYNIITLDEPLQDVVIGERSLYFIVVDGLAYKVKKVISLTEIEVHHLDIGLNNRSEATVYIGGGLDIEDHGDNGVGKFSSMDVISNRGIGIHINALYGHQMDNMVLQANGIGLGLTGTTIGQVYSKPYFEMNHIDIVSYQDMGATIISPVALNKMQFLLNRQLNGLNFSKALTIINDNGTITANNSSERPMNSPGTRALIPSKRYAFTTTGGAGLKFVIENDEIYTTVNNNFIEINVQTQNSVSLNISLRNGWDTIEGNETFTSMVFGHALIKLYKVGSDWKVLILQNQHFTRIDRIPTFIGQEAYVGEHIYKAIGTTSEDDWKANYTVDANCAVNENEE